MIGFLTTFFQLEAQGIGFQLCGKVVDRIYIIDTECLINIRLIIPIYCDMMGAEKDCEIGQAISTNFMAVNKVR